MSWYDYKKAKNGIAPSIIKDVHVAFYSKDYDWGCYDEHHSAKSEPFDSIICYVENGYQTKDCRDKSKVFIHCTNGNTYELKVEKINWKNPDGYYNDSKKRRKRKQKILKKKKPLFKKGITKFEYLKSEIQNMSAKDFAEFLYNMEFCNYCVYKDSWDEVKCATEDICKKGIQKWLNEEKE